MGFSFCIFLRGGIFFSFKKKKEFKKEFQKLKTKKKTNYNIK